VVGDDVPPHQAVAERRRRRGEVEQRAVGDQAGQKRRSQLAEVGRPARRDGRDDLLAAALPGELLYPDRDARVLGFELRENRLDVRERRKLPEDDRAAGGLLGGAAR
jgi:hypothetical protein